MSSNWYETFFHGVALELWSKVITPEQTRAEAGFLEKALALEPGARILDVPCGNGRLSLDLAARGYTGTGVDLAEEYIQQARQSRADWTWLCADMRQLPREPAFDAAFCWGNSFGYLDHEGTRAFLAAVSAALKPGARFALESGAVAECLLPSFQPRQWYPVGDILMLADRRYVAAESRLDINYTFIRDGKLDTRPASQCVYTAAEVQRLLAEAGLETETLYSSAAGEPFQFSSPRMILVARKRL